MKAQVSDSADLILGEVAGEFFERLARGERPQIEEYARKYPELAEQIRRVIPALELVGSSSSSATGGAASREFSAPQRLGDFQIIRELGRGGMGVVYEAEQLSMGRRVALKVLPFAAMVQAQALQRFRNEVRAAAALTHDHIVSVYSIGEERGVHYYAMQLIRGQSLAEVISQLVKIEKGDVPAGSSSISRLLLASPAKSAGDEDGGSTPTEPVVAASPAAGVASPTEREIQARLSTAHKSHRGNEYFRSAVRLGIEAAEALQHAHDQGVIHRDIKPGNLLLDADARLYITDFGLARIEADAGLTMSGDLIGTLRYMAPEQALAKRVVVDHRADIYSLGATLYELLTLEPPFAESDRKELLKQIAFQDPRPLRKLDRCIPTDLETIILKSMEKDPGERYQTAEAFAADLRAFLEHRPIRARAPMLLERGLKWCRRQPGIVATAAAALTLATIGLAISNVLIAQQRNAAQIAQGNEAEQRKEAEKKRDEARDQRIEAEKQKKIAEENFQRARKAVDDYFTKVSESQLLDVPSLQPLRKDLLELARKYYEEFAKEHQDDPAIRAELAATHLRLGKIYAQLGSPIEAEKSLGKALRAWKEIEVTTPTAVDRSAQAEIHLELAKVKRDAGDAKAALASCQESVVIAKGLLRTATDVPEHRHLLARAYNALGEQHRRMGEPAAALVPLHQAASLWEGLLAANANVLLYQSGLVSANQNVLHAETDLVIQANIIGPKTAEKRGAELAAQAELFKMMAALEGMDEQSRTIIQQGELARLYVGLGDLNLEQSDALPYCEKGIKLYATLVRENPAVLDYKYGLARAYSVRSRRQASLRAPESWKREEAIQSLRAAVRVLEELVQAAPANANFRSSLGFNYKKLAWTLDLRTPVKGDRPGIWEIGYSHDRDEVEEVKATYKKAIEHLEKSLALDSEAELDRIQLGEAYRQLCRKMPPTEERERQILGAIKFLKDLGAAKPEAPAYWRNMHMNLHMELVRHYTTVAQDLGSARKSEELLTYWKKVVDLCKQAESFKEEDYHPKRYLQQALRPLAASHFLKGNLAQAIDLYTEQIDILKSIQGKDALAKSDLCFAYYWRGKVQSEAGRQADGKESWQRVIDQCERIEEGKRQSREWLYFGLSLYELGRYPEARKALEAIPDVKAGKGITIGQPWWYLAMIRHRLGETQEAKAMYDQLDALLKKEASPDPWLVRFKTEAAEVLGIKPE